MSYYDPNDPNRASNPHHPYNDPNNSEYRHEPGSPAWVRAESERIASGQYYPVSGSRRPPGAATWIVAGGFLTALIFGGGYFYLRTEAQQQAARSQQRQEASRQYQQSIADDARIDAQRQADWDRAQEDLRRTAAEMHRREVEAANDSE